MRDNEIVGLWEAYLQVHQPKEEVEQLDEDFQGAVKGALEKGARATADFMKNNPFGKAIKPFVSPVGPGSGTVTAAQQKAKIKPIKPVGEEVENWVNSLIDEGYDLSEYTWEDMYEMYVNLDEAKSRLPTRGIDPELYSQFYGNASRSKKVKGKKTPQPGQNRYLTKQNQKRSAERYAAAMGRNRTPSASDYDNHGGGSRNEETDLFDAILEHLVAEGYADTNESALVIMANMSEEWREEILDEAVRGSGRSIGNRITGNDIRGVTRKGKTVYKKPKWKDDVENEVHREYSGYALRRQGETENMNDRRDRERIEANRKSIQTLNAKPGEDPGDYDAGYHGDDDTSNGKRHYSLSRTNRDARRRRASGR